MGGAAANLDLRERERGRCCDHFAIANRHPSPESISAGTMAAAAQRSSTDGGAGAMADVPDSMMGLVFRCASQC